MVRPSTYCCGQWLWPVVVARGGAIPTLPYAFYSSPAQGRHFSIHGRDYAAEIRSTARSRAAAVGELIPQSGGVG